MNNAKRSKGENHNKKILLNFLKQLPKIELHAHLNGCIRESTLMKLAEERNVTLSPLLHHDLRSHQLNHESQSIPNDKHIDNKVNTKRRSLQECFEIFAEISKCVTDLNALRRITYEALHDFAEQNVAYLELRSTPKVLYHDISHKTKATKKDYVDTILQVMEEFETEKRTEYQSANSGEQGLGLIMIPRFIISINRAETLDNAKENASLAMQYTKENDKYVLGVDLSGNPLKRSFHDLEPIFSQLREAGLKTSIHCGELPCEHKINEKEREKSCVDFACKDTNAILSFRPDRLGHSLLLTESMFSSLENIPVECCPTSNVMTLELAKKYKGDLVHGLKFHPRLKAWIKSNYPISINTDDPGIFNTNSTLELVLLAEAFEMKDPWMIVSIVQNSIDHIFESENVKQRLKEEFAQKLLYLKGSYYGLKN